MGDLDEYEEKNIASGLVWLIKQKEDPKKYNFWLKLHKKLFENTWSWAGKIRTHELENPDFCHPLAVWPQLYQLELDLNTWITYKSYSYEVIATKFHERIETIHPFANGNGRFGRIITEKICSNIQSPIPTWGKQFNKDPAERRKRYIAALTMARREYNYSPLAVKI